MNRAKISPVVPRREFLRHLVVLGSVVTAVRQAVGVPGTNRPPDELPKIRLGDVEVSRLVLGSNPFFGFSHGNPQATPEEMTAYYTDDQIMTVLDAAADHGITAVWTPCYERWIHVWNRYRERGGRLKNWIAQPDRLPMEKEIRTAAQNGAKAVCIQGIRIDEQFNHGEFDVIRAWLELIKSLGLPAGMATHGARTHLVAEQKGFPTDFYHQTLYRPDNYIRKGLEESLATIEKLKKPVVAYKVLGAGRIAPRDTLPEVFKHLRPKDGVCIGVFPKKRDEIAENTSLTRRLS